jgi:hypothetical protein
MNNLTYSRKHPACSWRKRCGVLLALMLGMGLAQARQPRHAATPDPGAGHSRTAAESGHNTDAGQGDGDPDIKLDLNIRDLMPDMLLAAPHPAGSMPSQAPAERTVLMLSQQAGSTADSGSSLMPLISNDSRRYIKAPVEKTMPELDQPTVDDDQPTVGVHMKVDF